MSACLIARSNAHGEKVEISLRGPRASLHPGPGELVEFPVEEATYFGNLFSTPQQIFAASARDDLALPRTCGDSPGCPIEVLGHSDEICDTSSRARGRDGCPSEQAITVYLR